MKKSFQVLGLLLLLPFVWLILGAIVSAHKPQPSAPPPPSCATSLLECTDSYDAVTQYKDISLLRFRCKRVAADRTKYGEPKWSAQAFESFFPAATLGADDVLVLTEENGRFQNRFGVWTRTRVECRIDLATGQVTSVVFH
jgi:hypothetical protein